MAEGDDGDDKTEEPSAKKIEDALAKGQTPHAREPAIVASLLVLAVWLSFSAQSATVETMATLRGLLILSGTTTLGVPEVRALSSALMQAAASLLAPLLVGLMISGIVAGVVQAEPRLVLERIRPQASRLSIGKGMARLFGKKGWAEFLKSVVKLAIVGTAVTVVARGALPSVTDFMLQPAELIGPDTGTIVLRLLLAICVVMVAVAVVDVVWTRHAWRQGLRMTRKETSDETKQSDGDPILKARRRSIAQDRARTRMMAAVPGATLVIANPTHVAVALRYRHESDPAPVVVAKGADVLCLRIRALAEENGVPVFERIDLARALFKVSEVDKPIPGAFYEAVAALINFVTDPARRR
ncbi:flagellar type III secretion system protein FlhB [Rhizobiaceae bacterium]|nr:flagellar type III secretion system protein FlhB [Rhizobiaceae bacterium]